MCVVPMLMTLAHSICRCWLSIFSFFLLLLFNRFNKLGIDRYEDDDAGIDCCRPRVGCKHSFNWSTKKEKKRNKEKKKRNCIHELTPTAGNGMIWMIVIIDTNSLARELDIIVRGNSNGSSLSARMHYYYYYSFFFLGKTVSVWRFAWNELW